MPHATPAARPAPAPAPPPATSPSGTGLPDASPSAALRPKTAAEVRPKPWTFYEIPPHVQQYLSCIAVHMVLPLLPVLFEIAVAQRVQPGALHLVASMYAISLGVSSKSLWTLVYCGLFAFVFAALYGPSTSPTAGSGSLGFMMGNKAPVAVTVLVFVLHAMERYNRHVANRAPFWEFGRRGDE